MFGTGRYPQKHGTKCTEMVTLKLIHTVQPIKTVWIISCSKIYDCNHWFIQFIELFHVVSLFKRTDVLYERVGRFLEVANFLKKPSSPAWFSDFVSWVVVMVDWTRRVKIQVMHLSKLSKSFRTADFLWICHNITPQSTKIAEDFCSGQKEN